MSVGHGILRQMVNDIIRLVVLVPHRDAVLKIRQGKRKLFSQAFFGAYSFPIAAPLARLDRPLNINELKNAAEFLREERAASGGVICGGGRGAVTFTGGYVFFGTVLSLSAPMLSAEASPVYFPQIILCETLIEKSMEKPTEDQKEMCIAAEFPLADEKLSFRAAALANMVIRELETPLSFEWKIGRAVWL
ncbi:MAG: hypothetical protein LBV68_07145 [Spirochaetaceae bacterium]|nr:hypothetical protein [Spirochaetaceae bacterium]